ncbi:hypothetical protein V1509DRAFT_618484 [Lipomyces kononenkoae]
MTLDTTLADGSRFVGSASWIDSEISNMQMMLESNFEDFTYAAKDELDWLGDRMDSILRDSISKTDLTGNVLFSPQSERGKLTMSASKNQAIGSVTSGNADKENINPLKNGSKLEPTSRSLLPLIPPAHASSTASSSTSSPTARRQATLPVVAEFNSDPISLPSSSSAVADDYVEGDFFGALERRILALPPGAGHALTTDTSDDELSPPKVISSHYHRTVNDHGESQVDTLVHYNNVGENNGKLEFATSDGQDITTGSGTDELPGDVQGRVSGFLDAHQVPRSSPRVNQEEEKEMFTPGPEIVTRKSPMPPSPTKPTPSGSSFRVASLHQDSSPSQQASFYSANEDESMQDENDSSIYSKRSCDLHAQSSPVIGMTLRQQPLAQSTPSNGLSNGAKCGPALASSSIARSSDHNEPQTSLSLDVSLSGGQTSSPLQLYPSLQSPKGARPPPVCRSMKSPSTPRSGTAGHQITTVDALDTAPSVVLSVVKNSQVPDAIPAKAPATTILPIEERLSGVSGVSSSLLAETTSEVGLDSAVDKCRCEKDPVETATKASTVSQGSTPQQAPPKFSIKLSKAELLADRQTIESISESMDVDKSQQISTAYTIPSLPSYRNLHDMMTEPQDEEEDWIPLSKATPAPSSRFITRPLSHNMPFAESKPVRKSADTVPEEDEDDEEEDEIQANEVEHDQRERANDDESASRVLKGKVPKSPIKGYYASTASSRSKLQASPVRQSPMKSPSRQNGLPARRPVSSTRDGSNSLKPLPVRPFTRSASPVRVQSPLRNVVSRPASPSRKSSEEDNESASPSISQSGPATMSPSRSGGALIRAGGIAQVTSGRSIAAATAIHAASQSPMTSAFKNMKSSTADVFRKARLLLFDSNGESKSRTGGDQHPEINVSPVKKPSQETLNAAVSPAGSKSLYPDVPGTIAESVGSPGRKVIRIAGFERNLVIGTTSNPTKVSVPESAMRSSTAVDGRVSQSVTQLQLNHQSSHVSFATASNTSQRSSIGLSHTSGTSTQKTSLDDICDSGGLQPSPDLSTSNSVASAASLPSNSTSSSTSNGKPAGGPLKRVKSAIRKPPARAKHAPVVVRVPMGAQRELEQQRKIAAAAALSQLSPQVQSDSQLAAVIKTEEDKKAEQKREIERRRHETTRRAGHQQQQQQDEKKPAEDDDQARRKYNLTNRNSRVPQAQTRPGGNLGIIDDSKSLKRNFQGEGEISRLKTSIVPTTTDQSKRRRTDELTGSPLESRLRPSAVRKDVVAKSSQQQQQQQQQISSQPQNLMKAVVTNHGRNMPFVEGVKFSNDKIRFAVDSGTASRTNSNVNALPATTPGRQNLPMTQSGIQQFRLSQLAQMPVNSGDHIALPDIHSESEDDDDSSVILDWAHSPFLQEALRQQQRVDPDTVFGPVPPLSMEEVFRTRAGGTARFRPRSSSANWSNNDRLTPQEIESYATAMGYNYDNMSGNGSMQS